MPKLGKTWLAGASSTLSPIADMDARLTAFFPFLFEWEGRTFENDPDDPGGATKFGIDQRSHPGVDIRNLTEQQAKEIYDRSYWRKNMCDIMPYPLGEVYFNYCVNLGAGRCSLWLQALVGVKVDGFVGPMTMSAVAACNAATVAKLLVDRADSYYRDLATHRQFGKFLRGWLNRNAALRRYLSLSV